MDVQTKLRIEGLTQVAVTVRDVDRAVGFYRDVLGLELLFRIENAAFFDCRGVRLMLAIPESPEFDHPASVLYYRVGDIQESWATLLSHEVKTLREPHVIARMPGHDLWMAFFADPEGNVLALTSEVPREG